MTTLIIVRPPFSWGTTAVSAVDMVLSQAVQQGASDIHLQPQSDYVIVRFRINGVLCFVRAIAHDLAVMMVSRLKVLSDRDIMQAQQPQDGSLQANIGGAMYDVRLSFFPSLYGEKVVMRMLRRDQKGYDLSGLGLSAAIADKLASITHQLQGFFLATGPTGAGKSTTLYAMLQAVNRSTRNVVTLEDPVEYRLDDVTQTAVNTTDSFRFSDAMRCLLRQDPDVALIGEIRDRETACSAIEAALTGHLVLSTLHATHASAVPIRLREMGVPGYLVASSLTGVLAQRLVPLLCCSCKEAVPIGANGAAWLEHNKLSLSADWQARGCAACYQTGIEGRGLLAELFIPDQQARAAMAANTLSLEQLQAHAQRCGMIAMRSQGFTHVLNGDISLASLIELGI